MPKLISLCASTCLAAALLFAPSIQSPAQADEASAQRVADHVYGKGIGAGIADLKGALAKDEGNTEARFGLGVLQFLHAIEGLQQDFYRYGVGNRQGGTARRGLANILPVFRVPVPPNPKPETADYEKVRFMLELFVARLAEAEATLAGIGDAPVKLPLNLIRIRLDANNDGRSDETESLKTILSALQGRGRSGLVATALQSDIAFDTADAKWLQGYSNVLMSLGNFFLSFDFRESYEATFHAIFGNQATAFGQQIEAERGDKATIIKLIGELDALREERKRTFPSADSRRFYKLRSERKKINRDKSLSADAKKTQLAKSEPEFKKLQQASKKNNELYKRVRQQEQNLLKVDPNNPSARNSYFTILDAVSLLHTMSWPVVEPDRLKQVRLNLVKMAQLNRETWRLVRTETDNDREWLPNSKQASPFVSLKVTDEMIDAWLKTIDALEQMLEGNLMVPNMRFVRGVNMKKFFDEATRFDPVMFVTGVDAVPFLQEGSKMDQSLMRTLNSPFGRNFNAYAIWFN